MSDFENKYNPEPFDAVKTLRRFMDITDDEMRRAVRRFSDQLCWGARGRPPEFPDGPSLNLVVEGDVVPVEDV